MASLTLETTLTTPHSRNLHQLCGVFKAVDDPTFVFELPHRPSRFTIGRDLECDQPLLGKDFLSRLHCAITSILSVDLKQFFVFVTDLSKNGCLVNGVRIPYNQAHAIESGSVLAFGGPQDAGPSFVFTKYDPRSIFSQYALGQAELGRGTFGTVIEARSRIKGHSVAVKMLKLGDRSTSAEEERRHRTLIRREVNLMASIRHPHIIRLENAMLEDRMVYVVMELASHGNLSTIIRREGRLSANDTKIVSQQLCAALLFLHGKNVIHRDVKPANILISSLWPPCIKITDFGLAKVHDSNMAVHTMCGTPAYMAPEVCSSNGAAPRYDFKVDSWSVGVTIIHMLAGHIPFSREDIQLDRGIDNRVVEYATLPATWTLDVRDLIVRLCRRDPTRRLSMAGAVSHNWLV